ncbi:unannotated protein [freshwater metagenome]|uniref:Unannotated protein n=1 Tax=freshwater metagenome TaxID=449393 RepID=A0A6J7VPN0_9ZZZZ
MEKSIQNRRGTLLAMTTTQIETHATENISSHHDSYPRLKNGVYISRLAIPEEESIHLATSHHAIEIFHGGARAIISQLNGLQTPEEISTILSAPIELIDRVLTELKNANFIDTVRNKITLHNRFQSTIASRSTHTQDQSLDAAFVQLQKRLAPELSQATWIVGVNDGGVELLSNRQNFGIEIFGSSRTATLICSILLASGVTNTRMALTSMQQHPTIGDIDLGTGALRTSDIGLNFRGRLEELSREWSLFPVASHRGSIHKPVAEIIPERNLRIIVGNYEPELIEHLNRDTQDHLFVGKIAGGVATCGPLVRPGMTPCIDCLALGVEERNGRFQRELMATQGTSDELPIAIAHQLAAIAAHTALRFIDTGSSQLAGAQIHLDYQEPLAPTLNSFPRHPRCECVWKTADSELKLFKDK